MFYGNLSERNDRDINEYQQLNNIRHIQFIYYKVTYFFNNTIEDIENLAHTFGTLQLWQNNSITCSLNWTFRKPIMILFHILQLSDIINVSVMFNADTDELTTLFCRIFAVIRLPKNSINRNIYFFIWDLVT